MPNRFRPSARRAAAILPRLLCLALAAAAMPRAEAAPPPGIDSQTRGMERREGFLPFYLDRSAGKIWLELPPAVESAAGVPVLAGEGLTSGLGSNPVGLDRSLLATTQYAIFRRAGGKVLLEAPNLSYRAESRSPDEQRAVRQSFATSVLFGAAIAARDADGRLLIDLTPYLVRDAVGIARAIEETGQGSFTLDADRSAVDLEEALAFPDNVEFDALLTFAGKKPGPLVRETTPSPDSVTLVAHHSFVRPPDAGYRPRAFDPRAGSIPIGFRDYAAPLDQPVDRLWIVRHRLQKVDPSAPRSRVKKPILYYVDRGAPEPIRSALIEGASWWAEAFDAAGFIDAFRVELLPEGVHPLDARFNVIHWVHRSTRGWSYGGGMTDPRTGEQIKGNVLLGSLRVRHDRLLFEGLAGTSRTGTGAPDDPVVLALARIRQLAAHEVGHALGFVHNFAASTYGRGSVMDYPAPLVGIRTDGSLDFSSAYATGIGAWDRLAVQWAYGEFPGGGDDAAALDALLADGRRRGVIFLTDDDARPEGASHPIASLWDNGKDPLEEMDRILAVRRIALERFGQDAVAPGRPLALTLDALTPLYFHHRYQMDVVAKLLGGMEYDYVLRGDGQPAARIVSAPRQRAALASLLRLLEPKELDLPERVLELLLPRPPGYPPSVDLPSSQTAPAFDALGAAATAATAAVRSILQPQRAARVIDFHRRDPLLPGLDEILDRLVEKAFAAAPAGPRLEAIAAVVRRAVADGLMELAADPRSSAPVRAEAERAVRALAARLAPPASRTPLPAAEASIAADLERFLQRPLREPPSSARPAPLPPGSPIGSDEAMPWRLSGCSLAGD